MKKILVVLLACVPVLFFCCKKKDNVSHISPDLLAHFSYKVGSYWVYGDSISGKMDSFYVVSNDLKSQQLNSGSSVVTEFNDMYIYEVNIDGGSARDTSVWNMHLADSTVAFTNINNSFSRYSRFFVYPFSVHKYINDDSVDVSKIYNEFTVNGMPFSNVAVISHSSTYYKRHDVFYVSDDVGIVKMIFNHDVDTNHINWLLQRHFVIK